MEIISAGHLKMQVEALSVQLNQVGEIEETQPIVSELQRMIQSIRIGDLYNPSFDRVSALLAVVENWLQDAELAEIKVNGFAFKIVLQQANDFLEDVCLFKCQTINGLWLTPSETLGGNPKFVNLNMIYKYLKLGLLKKYSSIEFSNGTILTEKIIQYALNILNRHSISIDMVFNKTYAWHCKTLQAINSYLVNENFNSKCNFLIWMENDTSLTELFHCLKNANQKAEIELDLKLNKDANLSDKPFIKLCNYIASGKIKNLISVNFLDKYNARYSAANMASPEWFSDFPSIDPENLKRLKLYAKRNELLRDYPLFAEVIYRRIAKFEPVPTFNYKKMSLVSSCLAVLFANKDESYSAMLKSIPQELAEELEKLEILHKELDSLPVKESIALRHSC